jgi:GTP-binding protein
MRFIDQTKIHVAGGDGGRGCLSFRREKYVPRGGPDGGDGGRGGDVVLEATSSRNTLLSFHYRNRFAAQRGRHGRGKNQHGKSGEDLVIEVPAGTLVKDLATGELLVDLAEPGQRWIAAKGGRGGRGNARFATSTNRAPREFEDGEPGEARELELELKLLADAGLVGLPNAGKSTLLRRVSQARPKVADYPFTTLKPILGVVRLSEDEDAVLADIPGIIEGAHQGAGLGLTFLKHVERTRVLVHLVDGAAEDPVAAYETVVDEVKGYGERLAEKPALIALNKMDLPDAKDALKRLKEHLKPKGLEVMGISALTGEGVDNLLAGLRRMLGEPEEREAARA